MSQQRYVPAAGRAWLTGLYDPVMTVTMREGRWRPALLDEVAAKLPDAGTVVDVGAGTGSFAIALSAARRLSTAWGTLELLSARRPTTTDAP